ncbi:MAG: LysR family transcriptional regulator [Clostridia bacterium]|nr:LysR family transcriptional regulator [Clostridia bacterium]
MNILHMKYAVEVARLGSLNKASESLLIAQPNISRSIKELEADLGITIFNRSAKGMVLTPDGEEFINYAHEIIKQIDQVEMLYKKGVQKKQKFSISVPRACYISEAFAQFSKSIESGHAEIFYKETNSQRTIHNVMDRDYKLGIIRYAENYDKYFKAMLEEKGLFYELVAEFSYILLMSRENPLAAKETITFNDLTPYIEIAHADPYVPSLPLSKVVKEELPDNIDRRIFIFERASQFDLLSENPQTFMWVSPTPAKILARYNLVQRKCVDNQKIYKDVLIYREGYKLSKLDKQFITALCASKREYLDGGRR